MIPIVVKKRGVKKSIFLEPDDDDFEAMTPGNDGEFAPPRFDPGVLNLFESFHGREITAIPR